MTSAHDSEPLFHYRNWAVDNFPSNFPDDDDDDSLEIEYSTRSLDLETSALQRWGAPSALDESQQSLRQRDCYISQSETRAGPAQQHDNTSIDLSIQSGSPVDLARQNVENIASFLHNSQHCFEPWNPLTGSRTFAPNASLLNTGDMSSWEIYGLHAASHYYTATSDIVPSEAFLSATSYVADQHAKMGATTVTSDYLKMLKSKGLWPVDPQIEQNWSGEGQHVEFEKGDTDKINRLLSVGDCMGSGAHGSVHKVTCRRISMARKTILTRKQFTKNDAIREVLHMARLKHAHIIRLMGTYVRMRELCILMYPVADGNLVMFLKYICKRSETTSLTTNSQTETSPSKHPFDINQIPDMATSCLSFFSCLSCAIKYIHSQITKHMDIKPENVLVRSKWHYTGGGQSEYVSKVYLSDFGISRSYDSMEAANTDSNIGFTKKYAAPEVVQWLDHHLSADIFSLGCVFLEMFAALDSYHARQTFHAYSWRMWSMARECEEFSQKSTLQEELDKLFDLAPSPDKSYQGNIEPLQKLLQARMPRYARPSILNSSMLQMISSMLQVVPQDRPMADEVVGEFGEKACCNAGTIELEAIDVHVEDDAKTFRDYMAKEEQMQWHGRDDASQNQVKAETAREINGGPALEAERYLLLGLGRGDMSL